MASEVTQSLIWNEGQRETEDKAGKDEKEGLGEQDSLDTEASAFPDDADCWHSIAFGKTANGKRLFVSPTILLWRARLLIIDHSHD